MIDCYSRRVLGWSMRDRMPAELVVDALKMAINRRRPTGKLVHHSDQGSQYVALIFGQRLRKARIAQSMGSKSDCYDNAACESFHATLEKELPRCRSFRTKHEARTAIFGLDRELVQPRAPPLPPRLPLTRPMRTRPRKKR